MTSAEPTLEQALEGRPELRLARQILRLNDAQTAYQVALARPNIDGVAGYKRSKNFDTVMWGVQMPLPVFNRNQGNIESAVAERRAGEAAVRSTESLVRAEHQAAVLELDIRRRQLREAVGPLRDRARRTAQIADSAYRLGGADLLRLLDAQRQRIDAELLYIQTLQGYLQAKTALDAAAGVIP
jgi:outer membrane protein TolC